VEPAVVSGSRVPLMKCRSGPSHSGVHLTQGHDGLGMYNA
jgi:hypothetical protein